MGSDGIVFNVLVTVVFLLVALQLLFPLNHVIPLDRRMASTLGSVLCTCIVALFPQITNINTGSLVDFAVLLVLVSIMAINFMLLRQTWLRTAILRLQSFIANDVHRGFYCVSLISFAASPFILNDGLCLMLVHPVLDAFVQFAHLSISKSSRDGAIAQSDAYYYMLTIACSANIGSTLTYSGNPQNVIVAQYLGKFMNCATFFALMLIPALSSWLLTTYWLDYCRKDARNKIAALIIDNSLQLEAVSAIHDQNSEIDDVEQTGLHAEQQSKSIAPLVIPVDKDDPMSNAPIVFVLFGLLIVLEFAGVFPLSGLFTVISVLMISATVFFNHYRNSYHFLSKRNDNYDIVSAVSIGLVDHKREYQYRGSQLPPQLYIRKIAVALEELFHQLDYNLLIIFIGLFVVSGSFLLTEIPKTIWNAFAGKSPFQSARSVVVLSIYIIVASQLVGNVPVVYMAKEEVQLLDKKAQIFGWLVLSFVSTVAGNFTLVGSAANIIVVEKALRHREFPVDIKAIPHFRICGLVTLICITLGTVILYVESIMVM